MYAYSAAASQILGSCSGGQLLSGLWRRINSTRALCWLSLHASALAYDSRLRRGFELHVFLCIADLPQLPRGPLHALVSLLRCIARW